MLQSGPELAVLGVGSALEVADSSTPPLQLLAVLHLGCGAAGCPAGSEAFDHCGESDAGQGRVLKAREGLRRVVHFASALKPVERAAWPCSCHPEDEFLRACSWLFNCLSQRPLAKSFFSLRSQF